MGACGSVSVAPDQPGNACGELAVAACGGTLRVRPSRSGGARGRYLRGARYAAGSSDMDRWPLGRARRVLRVGRSACVPTLLPDRGMAILRIEQCARRPGDYVQGKRL